MSALSRAGWTLAAAFFATLLASIAHVDYVTLPLHIGLWGFALLAAVRPAIALQVLAAAVPVVWYVFAQRWNPAVPWAEALVCAALAGFGVHAAFAPRGDLPPALRAPALVFGAIVAAAVVAALGVPSLRLGSGFRDALATQLLREYFIDSRGFPALHTGMLLIEGTLLFAVGARIAAQQGPALLGRLAAMTAGGAALAAAMNLARLHTAAARAEHYWTAALQLSRTVRWNVHYADFNAAGSFFAMALLAALALAATARTTRTRVLWIVSALTIAAALWLTASRAAYLAMIVALAAAAGTAWLRRSGRRVAAGLAIAAVTLAVIAGIALAAPMRGNQHSSLIAADVRLGMAAVAGRMIATRPAFGIGPGEFNQRSGEFATPELIAKFPVAVHENAHNNFLQIAAELGLIGGAAFVWLVLGAFWVAARDAPQDRLRLLVAAGLGAFIITWLGGHPLLVPEAAYSFWLLLGTAAGAGIRTIREVREMRGGRSLVVAVLVIAIAATVPWRMRALMNAADLEHIGIGVSLWHEAADGIRYREAEGHATLFVPTTAFKFSVNPRTDTPVRLQVTLDGRVADIVTLAPRVWNDLRLPPRTERTAARFAALELRVLDGDQTGIWITKVEAIR